MGELGGVLCPGESVGDPDSVELGVAVGVPVAGGLPVDEGAPVGDAVLDGDAVGDEDGVHDGVADGEPLGPVPAPCWLDDVPVPGLV